MPLSVLVSAQVSNLDLRKIPAPRTISPTNLEFYPGLETPVDDSTQQGPKMTSVYTRLRHQAKGTVVPGKQNRKQRYLQPSRRPHSRRLFGVIGYSVALKLLGERRTRNSDFMDPRPKNTTQPCPATGVERLAAAHPEDIAKIVETSPSVEIPSGPRGL